MKTVMRRTAGLAIVGVTLAAAAVSFAPAASAMITSVSTPQLANTTTVGAETIASDTESVLLTGAVTQLTGPGTLTDTYAGTGTTVTPVGATCLPPVPPLPPVCVGGTSSIATTFNLDPTGLPAAPGTYALAVCTLTCSGGSITNDTTTLTVTGDPPTPNAGVTPVAIAPGETGAIDIPGTGFAKDDSLSLVRPGAAADDLAFTEDDAGSSATDLKGSVTVGAAVPAGVYDVTVTDTTGQSGVCAGCLSVTAPSPAGPLPVTDLVATDLSATTGSASWTASDGATSYDVVVAKNSSTVTDPGVTATVSGTSAAISGLAPAQLYYVTVTASDAAGTSAPVVTTLTTPDATKLTMVASAHKVADGTAVTISGVLTDTSAAHRPPVDAQTVKIYSKGDTGRSSLLKAVSTDSSGAYSFTFAPASNQQYVGYFPGAATSSPALSASLSGGAPRVKVSAVVTAKAKKSSTRHTAPLVVKGKVAPVSSGVTVYLLDVSSGHKHRLASTTVNAKSHFKFRSTKPTKRGTYTVEVLVKHHPGNAKGVSPKFRIKRT